MFDAVVEARRSLAEFAAAFDPAKLSGPEAVGLAAQLSAIRRLVDGLVAGALRRVDATGAHAGCGDRDAVALGARLLGVGTGEARGLVSTAVRLEGLPIAAAAVRAGRLSAREAQLIANAAAVNPAVEAELVEAAGQGLVPLQDACIRARALVEDPEARAARQHAERSVRTWTADDGMCEGRWRLPPEIGGQLKAVLDDTTRRIFRQRCRAGAGEPLPAYAADALVELVCGPDPSAAGDPSAAAAPARRRPSLQVHVVIDHAVLVRGAAGAGDTCEIPGVGPVNAQWVRELLGDAFVTAVIKKGKDITTVAHLGRHIPAELRTALIVAGRECDVEGCHERGYLEIDHSEIDHAHGGPTALWNLKFKCWRHHRGKHARVGAPPRGSPPRASPDAA
jgi:hypothetical protein